MSPLGIEATERTSVNGKHFLTGIGIGCVLALGIGSSATASPWEFAGAFPTGELCENAGQAGIEADSWVDYRCTWFEGAYDLYTR
jgi:hypothetical protein